MKKKYKKAGLMPTEVVDDLLKPLNWEKKKEARKLFEKDPKAARKKYPEFFELFDYWKGTF